MSLDISHHLAQDIVMEIKEIIHQDINYINTEGVIIASTVQNRVGTFHGGGKRVINTKRYLVINYDGEYKGALKGINIPIYFKNKITGVIGITGDKKEVENYGKIMKKMTELMIKDAYLVNLKNKNIENQRMVIEEMLNYNEDRRENLFDQMKVFNIKNNIPRISIISNFLSKDQNIIDKKETIWEIFNRRVISGTENLMMWERNHLVIILQSVSLEAIKHLLIEIMQELYIKTNLRVFFGVGTVENDIQNVKKSYQRAHIASNSSDITEKHYMNFYDEMDIELLIENIEHSVIGEFCSKVLGELTGDEKKEYAKIIKIFEKYNGSITRTAEKLFIHKNTLQYKINKLRSKTSYDMRRYRDFTSLKMAFLLTEREMKKTLIN